jgi:hypothetical protein
MMRSSVKGDFFIRASHFGKKLYSEVVRIVRGGYAPAVDLRHRAYLGRLFIAATDENMSATLTKLQVAVHQLGVAIQLFLKEDYLSSLTLAGAAEEILGKLSERAGQPVAIEEIIRFHWNDTDPALPDNERRKILLGVLNKARNAVKHANDPNEGDHEVEQLYPLQMIMRAMPMAKSLGLPPAEEAEMVAWIRAHPEATK